MVDTITIGFSGETQLLANLQGRWRVEVGLAVDPFSIRINRAFTFRRRRVIWLVDMECESSVRRP